MLFRSDIIRISEFLTISDRSSVSKNDDGSFDFDQDVDLSGKGLSEIPIKFGRVSGNFDCSKNQLGSLEGCPKEVGGNFICCNNKLSSLADAPISVGGDFNCSNNYGPYQFPEKLIPLFINNIRHRKPLPVYGKGENVRDWLYVEDHARAIDLIFHEGKIAETYNIGGFNEWKNIDLIKVLINTVDRLLGRPEGADMDLITYVTDRAGHDRRYAIDSTKLQKELGWEPSLQFEEGIEKTVRWYLDNQDWLDNVTSGDYQKYYEEMYKGR